MLPVIRYCCFATLFLAGTWSCKKEYSFEGNLSAGYLVKDVNNNCTLANVGGSYFIGKTMTGDNFLEVAVHISRTGDFNIVAPEVNGYSFSGHGHFSDTGTIRLRLLATGKPVNPGTDLFVVKYDSSSCEVLVRVLDTLANVVQVNNPDYFPLTNNSRWIYDDLSYPGDSIITHLNGASLQNGYSHNIQSEFISFYPATNENYFRRAGNDYYEYVAVSSFTSALDYAPSIYDDINFLKEGLHTGDTWYSDTYTGRTSFGLQVLVLRYQFTCVDANASMTINGQTFRNVYKITMKPQVADVGAALVATGEVHTAYYAKGVGLIYAEFFNGILPHPELRIRSWVIN
jgi:hypothetical protein